LASVLISDGGTLAQDLRRAFSHLTSTVCPLRPLDKGIRSKGSDYGADFLLAFAPGGWATVKHIVAPGLIQISH
jgi:hypothetical protein